MAASPREVRTFHLGPLCGMWFNGTGNEGAGFWFRVFGAGLHIRSVRGYAPLFSERYGFVKPLYVFGMRIQWLPKERGNGSKQK